MKQGRGEAAIYARYSGERQRETSIDDQVRNCTGFAEREALVVTGVFSDKAITGSTRARPGYLEMLDAATNGRFDVLLVDDLSRLSRDDYEMKGLLRRFAWQGIRVVGIADGYDSSKKGHKIHAGFTALKNELFLDDLRERTHRGMTGQALKGYNCGGRTFGYRNTPIEDPMKQDPYGRPAVLAVRYEIDESQAAVVRNIHRWYASGYSYKWIASELNRRRVPASRGGTWAISAVKVVLENEMYAGRLIWNRRMWMKHPDTGKRTYRERPREEWVIHESEELRLVPQEIIEIVRRRQQRNGELWNSTSGTSSAQRYILSGLMVCAQCGGNFVVVAAGRYGCASRKERGPSVCDNGMTVSRRIVEDRILTDIKRRLRGPGCVMKFKRAAQRLIDSHKAAADSSGLHHKLTHAERTRDNLIAAIKSGILTASVKMELESAEAEIARLNEQIGRPLQLAAGLPHAVERYETAVSELQDRLNGHIEPAREVLRSLLGEPIRIHHRGEYLEAEIPYSVPAILAKSLNAQFDSGGCGGGIQNESTFVSLAITIN